MEWQELVRQMHEAERRKQPPKFAFRSEADKTRAREQVEALQNRIGRIQVEIRWQRANVARRRWHLPFHW
jgi:hypothetical protein